MFKLSNLLVVAWTKLSTHTMSFIVLNSLLSAGLPTALVPGTANTTMYLVFAEEYPEMAAILTRQQTSLAFTSGALRGCRTSD